MLKLQKFTFTLIFLTAINTINAQEVMFQAWNWNYPTTQNGLKWVPYLDTKLEELNAAGFKHVWLPPLSRGASSTSMGYDVTDYYDLGQFRSTRWGNRAALNTLRTHADALNMNLIADIVLNHRDGGRWEDNPAVKGWITNFNATKYAAGDQPYPSDRVRMFLAIGGSTGRGAGTYYVKVKSASNSPNFTNKTYQFISWTNRKPADWGSSSIEISEPNGGGVCGQGNETVLLTRRVYAKIDNPAGCNYDEFKITVDTSQLRAGGDTLWFNLANVSTAGGTFGGANLGDMSDQRIDAIYYVPTTGAGYDIPGSTLTYQTMTDFSWMPSGRGKMNYLDFRPNGGPTCLCGDGHSMLFFYDLDQDRQQTRDSLFAYSRYMFQNAGMKGMRVDAVKHFPTYFMGDLLDNLYDNNIRPQMVVGESYDYSAQALKNWVDDVQNAMNPATKQNMNVRIFDFALREQMRQACDAFGYDVRGLMSAGCVEGAGMSGYNVVTFVNNHDFRDASQNQLIVNDPILPYAYILTNIKLGVPTVYYTDYYGANNMRGKINALMKATKRYIAGSTFVDYLNKPGQAYPHSFTGGYDNTSLLYQVRLGSAQRDVVMAINFAGERMKVDQQINDASVHPGDTLTDIFAVSGQPFTIMNAQKYIHMEVPPRSFGMWVKGDLRNQIISMTDTLYTGTDNAHTSPVFEENTLQLFPNPNDGNQVALAFESSMFSDGQISLINTVGQTVFTQKQAIKAGMEVYFIDLPTNLTNGVYFMTLEQNGKLFRQKLVIQH